MTMSFNFTQIFNGVRKCIHHRLTRTICQEMSTTSLMRYLFQNYLCCCIFTLRANKRRSALGWQLTDRNDGARGECLERPQKIIKRELVDLLFKCLSRDLWWLRVKSAIDSDDLLKTLVQRMGNWTQILSRMFCETSNTCRARRQAYTCIA